MNQKAIEDELYSKRHRCLMNILTRTERPKSIWWLSFCDADKEPGSQFLGAIMIHANELMEALVESHLRKINPGGECQAIGPLLESLAPTIDEHWKNRLLTKEECEAFDVEMMTKQHPEVSKKIQ